MPEDGLTGVPVVRIVSIINTKIHIYNVFIEKAHLHEFY